MKKAILIFGFSSISHQFCQPNALQPFVLAVQMYQHFHRATRFMSPFIVMISTTWFPDLISLFIMIMKC